MFYPIGYFIFHPLLTVSLFSSSEILCCRFFFIFKVMYSVFKSLWLVLNIFSSLKFLLLVKFVCQFFSTAFDFNKLKTKPDKTWQNILRFKTFKQALHAILIVLFISLEMNLLFQIFQKSLTAIRLG